MKCTLQPPRVVQHLEARPARPRHVVVIDELVDALLQIRKPPPRPRPVQAPGHPGKRQPIEQRRVVGRVVGCVDGAWYRIEYRFGESSVTFDARFSAFAFARSSATSRVVASHDDRSYGANRRSVRYPS